MLVERISLRSICRAVGSAIHLPRALWGYMSSPPCPSDQRCILSKLRYTGSHLDMC
jgi:hypothetical protein